MDIEEAPDQTSRRIGSQKSHQIVAFCHILSLLVRGCHGAHISIALSREWKERSSGFSVAMHLELVGTARSWQYPRAIRRYDHYCALGCNRCLMAREWRFLPCSSVNLIPVVPHKAVAEVSKIGNLSERLVVVNHGWQSESTDGPKGG